MTRTEDSYPAAMITLLDVSSSNATSSYPPSSRETLYVVGPFPVFLMTTKAEGDSYGVASIV